MYPQQRLRIWLVEPRDEEEVDGADGFPADAEVLDETAFRDRLEAGERPDALILDAGTIERLNGYRFALDGVLRTVIVTDRPVDDLPSAYLDRPSIRILRRPIDPSRLSRALLWLGGVEDDGWAAPASRRT